MIEEVIFLDIDGALNGHQKSANGYCSIHPSNLEIMNDLLDNLPHAKIVISSSWRYLVHSGSMTILGLENLFLSHGLKFNNRIIGITRKDGDQNDSLKERADQILEWVKENNVKKYVVIDDLDLPLKENFVKTNGNIGLTYEDADNVFSILTNKEQNV